MRTLFERLRENNLKLTPPKLLLELPKLIFWGILFPLMVSGLIATNSRH